VHDAVAVRVLQAAAGRATIDSRVAQLEHALVAQGISAPSGRGTSSMTMY